VNRTCRYDLLYGGIDTTNQTGKHDGWFNRIHEFGEQRKLLNVFHIEAQADCRGTLSKKKIGAVSSHSALVLFLQSLVMPNAVQQDVSARPKRTPHAMSHTPNSCMQTIIYSYHRTNESPRFHTSLQLILLLRRPRHLLVSIRASLPHLPCALPFHLVRRSFTVFVLAWVVMSSPSPVSTYWSCSTIIA
jgi:hypothetical protein